MATGSATDGWGGNTYPADWDTRRRQVYQRDGYTCQNCGARGGPDGDAELHAHHIVPKARGGTHALTNLTTLCRGCHNAVHTHDITSDSPATGGDTGSWGITWVDKAIIAAFATLYLIDGGIAIAFAVSIFFGYFVIADV